MKHDFKACRIDKVCAQELGRFAMTEILYDAEAKAVVATNGRILAVVPIDEPSGRDTAGFIPPAAWIAAGKTQRTGYRSENPTLSANGTVKVKPPERFAANGSCESEFKRSEEPVENFPQWRRIVPKPEETDRIVGIDVKWLSTLAEGLGLERVFLRIPEGRGKAILVNHPEKPERYGVIMPVVTE